MADNPTAALIVIGNEVLSGRTQDKNLNYLACKLTEHGIALSEVRVIPDNEGRIVEAVNLCRKQFSYVFTTGGIGPTHDDITSESVAKAFDVPFGRHDEAAQILYDYYGEEITDRRLRMARMPLTDTHSFQLILNPVSGAPGFQIDNVFVMAGVPRIMQAMLDDVMPRLTGGERIISQTLSAFIPESKLADAVDAIQQAFSQLEIGSYPQMKEGRLGTSIVVRGTDSKAIERAMGKVREAFNDLGDEVIEGEL